MKNNSIAFLVVLFIFILAISFFTSPKGLIYLSGRAVTASTSFNISEEISVLVTGSVNFGSGRVNPNSDYAIIESLLGHVFYDWYNISQVGTKPSARFGEAIYHEAKNVFIFYGSPFNETNYDTWMFNLSDHKWTQVSLNTHPSATRGFAMVYDSSTDEVVLYGGSKTDYTQNNPLSYETWKLNSSLDWVNVTNISNRPPALFFPSMAFDSNRNVVVMFGGFKSFTMGSQDMSNHTWEFVSSTNTWTNKTSSITGAPSSRQGAAMAYDSDNEYIVLFGGYQRSYFVIKNYFNDTWTYNGTHWVNVTASINNAPTASRKPTMVYDPIRKRFVLLTGGKLILSSNIIIENARCAGISGDLNYDGVIDSADEQIMVDMVLNHEPTTFCADFDSDSTVTSSDISYFNSGFNVSFWSDTWELNGTHWNMVASRYFDSRRTSIAFDSSSEYNNTFLFSGIGSGIDSYLFNDIWMFDGQVDETQDGFDSSINGTWFFAKQFFMIENDGTVNISVNYSADKGADAFIGGTNPSFKIRGVNQSGESGACDSLVEEYDEVLSSGSKNICPLLSFGNSEDSFRVGTKLWVPSDITAGEKNSTLTFTASNT